MNSLNPFGVYEFREFNECDKKAINSLIEKKKTLFEKEIQKHASNNLEHQLKLYKEYGKSPKDFLRATSTYHYDHAQQAYQNHILNPFSNPKRIQKRYTEHFFPPSKALLPSQEEMKLRFVFIKNLCDNNCFDDNKSTRFKTKNRQAVIKLYDRQRKLYFRTGICSAEFFAESLSQNCKDVQLNKKATDIFKQMFQQQLHEIPQDNQIVQVQQNEIAQDVEIAEGNQILEQIAQEEKNKYNLNIVQQIHTVVKNLEDMIACPIGLEPLTSGINLYPCNHKINQEYVKGYIGNVDSEGNCSRSRVNCLLCATPIKHIAIDHTVRQIASIIEDLAKLLVEEKLDIDSINNKAKELKAPISCPISQKPLTDAVNLHPCSHKINDEKVESLVGEVSENGFCEKQNVPCPICAVPIKAVGKDHTVRQISEAVEKILKLADQFR